MTIQVISPDEMEFFTLETHPTRNYISSSTGGIEGELYLFARRSDTEKDISPIPAFIDRTYGDYNLDSFLNIGHLNGSTTPFNNYSVMNDYLEASGRQSISARNSQTLEIIRFEPPFRLNSNTLRKLVTVDTLMPYYRTEYPTAQFGYNNYHSLNFFTASALPEEAALLYPNSASSVYPLGCYAVTTSFSFDFWINPRQTTDAEGDNFKAGTLFHLSSTYAVSLITGSSKDANGFPDGFRLLLQLSHSADISPSVAIPGTNLNDLVFLSDDNSLTKNAWHHVSIRWDGAKNNKTGSMLVDEVECGPFVIPFETVYPYGLSYPDEQPTVLVVGNYYEGLNTGVSAQRLFLSTDPAARDGFVNMAPGITGEEFPAGHQMRHPLNAEVHELKIFDKYIDDIARLSFASSSVDNSTSEGLIFYLPPFFSETSPIRTWDASSSQGGILLTPFCAVDGRTAEPFNKLFSFGVGGHQINLENFTTDLAQGFSPRHWCLTGSVISIDAATPTTANDYLYATGSSVKRNLLIAPCDNGLVFPNYDLLPHSNHIRFKNDLGTLDPSWISLRELVADSTFHPAATEEDGAILSGVVAATPDDLRHVSENSQTLTIFQRTRDNTSNQVVFFDISNMFYGNQIKPGTFTLRDIAISGSEGKMNILIKDDGRGNLYRADASTFCASWNSIGNIFYNEGIVVIKTPHLPFFGKDQFEINFQGVQNIHTLKFNLLARSKALIASHNATYDSSLSASFSPSNPDQRYVYITGINIHDENLNVITRTNLAQPLLKRFGDKMMFHVKLNY